MYDIYVWDATGSAWDAMGGTWDAMGGNILFVYVVLSSYIFLITS